MAPQNGEPFVGCAPPVFSVLNPSGPRIVADNASIFGCSLGWTDRKYFLPAADSEAESKELLLEPQVASDGTMPAPSMRQVLGDFV